MDDLLSNLPDDLLGHILSFLTTKEAALTSILSKRWRNLLAFVPNLDIDDTPCLQFRKYWNLTHDEILRSFMDFVDRVLALQGNSHIKKFSLRCIPSADTDRVDAWICNVLERGVSEIELSIDSDYVEHYTLSPKCFKKKKLVKLKIGQGIYIEWFDGSVFLPMLKTLVLSSMCLLVGKFQFILHALPVLEELVLEFILWEDSVVNISVSSATLKTLTIHSSGCVDTLSCETPSLVYFCYSNNGYAPYVVGDYPLVIMENLFEARISLLVTDDQIKRARAPHNYWIEDEVILTFKNVGKLMNGIRNVQYLEISSDTLEVLSLCCESMPVFKNLKTLTIKSDKSRGWQAMPVLLRNCPNLETLVLEGLLHHVTDKCGEACDCVSREDKGRLLTSCPVKLIEIQEFCGTMKEMHMIKHFSNYFPCLKEIKISIEENGPMLLTVPEVSEDISEVMEPYKKLLSRKKTVDFNPYFSNVFNHLLLIVCLVFFSSLTICS